MQGGDRVRRGPPLAPRPAKGRGTSEISRPSGAGGEAGVPEPRDRVRPRLRRPHEHGERSDAPDPRTVYANERTFLSWLRTGLAVVAAGFVVAKFSFFLAKLGAGPPPSASTVYLGAAITVLGGVIIWVGGARFTARYEALARRRPAHESSGVRWLAVALSAVSVALTVYLLRSSGAL